MIRLPTDQLYYNTRIWFAANIVNSLPNDPQSWIDTYKIWLADQGATIKKPQSVSPRIVDGLGISPGYDQFEFENDVDATVFILRWS